jgi:hypothetical protein
MSKLRDFLTLGVIIGAMPNQIANGTIIDAVPVMANFNWILAQVNANVGTALKLTTCTTTERDAFTGVVTGWVIFNTTVGKLQVCTATSGPTWQTVTST